jgi:hypothetical protein
MDLPDDILALIKEFSMPMTRGDWCQGSYLSRNTDFFTYHIYFSAINSREGARDYYYYHPYNKPMFRRVFSKYIHWGKWNSLDGESKMHLIDSRHYYLHKKSIFGIESNDIYRILTQNKSLCLKRELIFLNNNIGV